MMSIIPFLNNFVFYPELKLFSFASVYKFYFE